MYLHKHSFLVNCVKSCRHLESSMSTSKTLSRCLSVALNHRVKRTNSRLFFDIRTYNNCLVTASTSAFSRTDFNNSDKNEINKSGGKGPEDLDYEYDERRHEEYEREAQNREQRVRYFKKVFSSLLFMTTLVTVLYSRRQRKLKVDENLSLCTFLHKDENFQGSYNLFCRYGREASSPVLPVSIVKDGTIKAVKSLTVRPDDIFVASFPKTGTTWVQEIAYRIKTQDLKESTDILENRFPFLEYPYPGIGAIEKLKSPRFIKTHLTYDLLPDDISNAKIIYVTRNPKDTVVSYYHFARMLTFSSYKGTFEEFLQKFKKSELPYTPFFSHVDGYMAHSEDPNVLVVTYECLTRDPASVVRKIGNFLDVPLSEEEVQFLVEGTSFEKMKNNPGVNYEHWDELGLRNKDESNFMRKGAVGDWRHYFTSRGNDEFDIWEKENNRYGLKFEYEL